MTNGLTDQERAYRERIVTAVWAAILEASRDPATGDVHVRTTAVADELLSFIAFFAASSPETRTAKGRRAVVQTLAKTLNKQIPKTQAQMDRFDGRTFAPLH